jgi:hypothetical protein
MARFYEAAEVPAQANAQTKTKNLPWRSSVLGRAILPARCMVRIKKRSCPPGAWLGSRSDLIVEQGGNYLVALKGNQGTLHQAAKDLFEDALNDKSTHPKPDRASSFDVAHGREEERVCHVIKDLSQLAAADCNVESWRDSKCLIVIEARTVRGGKESFERRYYLSSGDWTAEEALARVRAH